MKRTSFQLLVLTFAAVFAAPVVAHPGKTASDGCHYCRTNCAKWGVPEGQRHCHYAPEADSLLRTSHKFESQDPDAHVPSPDVPTDGAGF